MGQALITLPVGPEELAARIAQVPRVHLAHLPTPLDACPRLSTALGGPQILVKRDDLTGLAFGGNKTRNLEFRMAEAIEQDADTVVVSLDVISNSARQTVAAANRLGLRTVLVLRGSSQHPIQGNLLVDHLLGAEIIMAEGDGVGAASESAVERLRQEGHRPFLLNASPMFAVASALAYCLTVLELREQVAALGLRADWVYLSSAGKGQAGVILGAMALGERFTTVGIAARRDPNREATTAAIANAAARLLGLGLTIAPGDVWNHADYVGAGYGLPTPEAIAAVQLVARTEGLILDPVYTGKAMAGLIDHIRSGRVRRDQTVVFIHTGGTPAIFAFGDRLLAEHPHSAT